MIIRKATIKDSESIANYLLLAMEDIIYKFICEENYNKAKDFLLHFITKENNQYSYQNCFVALEDNEIVAAVNIYDGAKLSLLREPIVQYVRTHYNKNFNPEYETQKGEYYIDTLGVDPKCQGKGIGSKMLQFLIEEYVNKNQQTLGLLVEEANPNAKKLYLKLGFKPVGEKTLVGKKNGTPADKSLNTQIDLADILIDTFYNPQIRRRRKELSLQKINNTTL